MTVLQSISQGVFDWGFQTYRIMKTVNSAEMEKYFPMMLVCRQVGMWPAPACALARSALYLLLFGQCALVACEPFSLPDQPLPQPSCWSTVTHWCRCCLGWIVHHLQLCLLCLHLLLYWLPAASLVDDMLTSRLDQLAFSAPAARFVARSTAMTLANQISGSYAVDAPLTKGTIKSMEGISSSLAAMLRLLNTRLWEVSSASAAAPILVRCSDFFCDSIFCVSCHSASSSDWFLAILQVAC